MKVNIPRAMGPRELVAALERDPTIRLLDVRTPREFVRAHLAGSCNVPLDQLEAHAGEIGQLRAPVVLVCRSGARARAAEARLRGAGMRNLHLLEGGLLAWRRERLPVRGRPLAVGERVRRAAGIVGLALALLYAGSNPPLALVLAVVGLRMAFGQPVLPCAAAGTCGVSTTDIRTHVRALIDGHGPDGDAATGPSLAASPAP